jgi:uncharacterized membrane protein AbrB (regulator of aidB expression)
MKKFLILTLLGSAICFIGNFINLQSAILMAAIILGFAVSALAEKMAPVYTCDTGGMDSAETPYKLEPKEE